MSMPMHAYACHSLLCTHTNTNTDNQNQADFGWILGMGLSVSVCLIWNCSSLFTMQLEMHGNLALPVSECAIAGEFDGPQVESPGPGLARQQNRASMSVDANGEATAP